MLKKKPKRKKVLPKRISQENTLNGLMKKCLEFRPKLTKILENTEFEKFHAIFVFFKKLGGLDTKDKKQG